ncbi:MAG: ribosomal protein S6--L-glutamate ligase [Phycisphaerales bacterium]|jgi:ribosomal protein S6--L-glutamate ligase
MTTRKLKVGILSRGPRLYSTRRIREAIKDRGHTAKVLDTLKFSISMEKGYPDLYYASKRVQRLDAVIPRIGASITFYGTTVVRQFQQMGVYSVNSALGISNSRDKLRSMQILSRHDIGIPATAFVRDRDDVMPTIERLGGAPVIIKLLEGTQGVGVILAETPKVAEAIVETLQSAKQNVLIQKFVAESKGTDIRAFVVGNRVVAAMRRRAAGGEYRSNVHKGGRTEAVELSEEYKKTAVRAAQIMGLQVAGVDMLEGADGPQIMELNSSPGLEGIERATGKDVAGAIIDHLVDHVKFPELDVRQKLTVSHGYGVSELQIVRGSDLIGKTLAASGLREQDVLVLSLENKNGELFPAPKGGRILRNGDLLVCYGRTQAMNDLTPERKTRRVRKLPKSANPQG